MTSVLSTKNSSTAPVLANGIFEGSYENITNFSIAVITVYADTLSQLTVYQSQLGTVPASYVQYQIPANTRTTYNVQIAYPYLYVTLDNLDGAVDQTFLNLCTIYRNTAVVDVSGGLSNVNIANWPTVFPITAAADLSVNVTNTLLDVSITNWPTTLATTVTNDLSVNVTNTLLDVSVTNWPTSFPITANTDLSVGVSNWPPMNLGQVQIFNGITIPPQQSTLLDLTGGANCLSLYGTAYDASCRLQVMFSPDTANWFGTQYVYTLDNSGDFGFNLPNTGAYYVALKILDQSTNMVAWGSYKA